MDTTLRSNDGLTLHLRHWPAAGAARGTVVIVHGLGEHGGRYAHVAAHLNQLSWQVFACDQRGHGLSAGAKGRIATATSLLRDLAVVIDHVRDIAPGPLFVLGHSMGGLIAARFVAEGLAATPADWYRRIDGLALSSPALDPGMNAWQKFQLALMAPLAPNLAVNNGLKPAWISRDAAVVQKYRDDPLVHDRITPRLVRFIVDGGEWVRGLAAQWKLPTLLLYAGSDRCVSPAGSAAFADAAPKSLLRTQAFPALFHEIFNEPEQAEVFAALADWLATRG